MLTLTRRQGERIQIGAAIEVKVLSVSRGRVRLGIQAPRELPVHRGELIDRIEEENLQARATEVKIRDAEDFAISFPEGLLGMRDHDSFVLCELDDGSGLQALVSRKDTALHLLVVDIEQVRPDYPIAEAREQSGIADDDVAVAAVVNARKEGATVNLIAPLVIGVQSRTGVQLILEREDFGVRHPLVLQPDGTMLAASLDAAAPE